MSDADDTTPAPDVHALGRVSDETLLRRTLESCSKARQMAEGKLKIARARIATLETLGEAMRTALEEQPGEPQLLAFLRKLPPSWIEAPNIDAAAALEPLRRQLSVAMDSAVYQAELDRARAVVEAARGLRDSGYDGPLIGDACEPLYAALRDYDKATREPSATPG